MSIRQEKNRPLLPSVYITGFQSPGQMRMQFDVFGLGQGSKMDNWGLREDVSLQLIWHLEGLGLGNLARIKEGSRDGIASNRHPPKNAGRSRG